MRHARDRECRRSFADALRERLTHRPVARARDVFDSDRRFLHQPKPVTRALAGAQPRAIGQSHAIAESDRRANAFAQADFDAEANPDIGPLALTEPASTERDAK
ncbi:hypothetical protein [Demequina flava]|uniref:hypothetical protein n=1 Tax=Demequina flava TaxID=1095025 RepID=UPI0007841551|nr:hypothetical protein [Demequina flava]